MNLILFVWSPMKNKKFAILIVSVVPFLLFSKELLTGQALYWGLPELQFYPWHALAFDQISYGILPLWNPYNGLGTPLLANYQSALVYPFTWVIYIFYLFGKLPAMVYGHMLVNVLHLGIAGIGMVYLCEEKKISWSGAAVAGLSFSLSGYIVARFGFFSMVWTAAWFPWVFLYTIRVFQSRKMDTNFIKLAISITLMLLAGHAQLSWYILMYCFLWSLSQLKRPFKGWIKNFLQFLSAGVLAALISAVQLFPTASLLLNSQRSTDVMFETAMTYSFWPWHFLNFLNPNFFGHPAASNYWGYAAFWEDAVYIGLLPLFLLLASIPFLLWKKKRKDVPLPDWLFLWITIIIAILLAMGNHLPIFPWLYKHIPSFDMFNSPARFMIWAVFSASILAGYIVDRWKKPQGKVLYWVRLGTASGFGVAIGAGLMILSGATIKPTLILAAFQISVLIFLSGLCYLLNPVEKNSDRESGKAVIWQAGVVLLVAADLLFMNIGSLPMQTIQDIQVLSKTTDKQTFYIPEAVDYSLRYDQVLAFQDYWDTLTPAELASTGLANVNIFAKRNSLNNFEPMRLAAYDEFIKALNRLNLSEMGQILPRYGIDEVLTFENTSLEKQPLTSIGAVYFTSGAEVASSVDDFLNKVNESECVFLMGEQTGAPEFVHKQDGSICEISLAAPVNYQQIGNKISFTFTAPKEGWLVINQTYDHGWQAWLNGNSIDVYPANGFVSTIQVPMGTSEIHLRYLPSSFVVGTIISLVSLLLTGILYYMIIRYQRQFGSEP